MTWRPSSQPFGWYPGIADLPAVGQRLSPVHRFVPPRLDHRNKASIDTIRDTLLHSESLRTPTVWVFALRSCKREEFLKIRVSARYGNGDPRAESHLHVQIERYAADAVEARECRRRGQEQGMKVSMSLGDSAFTERTT